MTDFGGFDPPSGPPAGWYPDPYGGPGQRYWDGSAWDLSTPVTGGPYTGADAEEFPDIGDWLDRSFRVAYRRWKALAFLGVITAPASTALAYLAINRLVDGVVIEGDDVTGWTNDRIPMAALLLLAAVVVGAVGSLSVNVLMLRAVDGADPPPPGAPPTSGRQRSARSARRSAYCPARSDGSSRWSAASPSSRSWSSCSR